MNVQPLTWITEVFLLKSLFSDEDDDDVEILNNNWLDVQLFLYILSVTSDLWPQEKFISESKNITTSRFMVRDKTWPVTCEYIQVKYAHSSSLQGAL